VGNPKTVLKGGYVGRKGGSSFASLCCSVSSWGFGNVLANAL